MEMSTQWRRVADAYEKRPPLEKAVIAVLAVGLIALLWLLIVLDPLHAGMAEVERRIVTTEARLTSLQARAAQARSDAREDPEQAMRERIARVIGQQQEVDRSIRELAGRLVPPAEMTRLLTTVLDEQTGLELQRVANREPEALRSMESGDEDTMGQLYRHGLVLELRGSYFDTLRYLQYLESLSGSFFWDSLEFRIEEWPAASITLELHTLSSEEGFVGVGV